jgi:hypothetical protein
VSLNWTLVLQSVIAGALVSWPVFIAGLVVSHRRTREHVDRVTARQTEQIAELTDAQTSEIAGALERRHQQGPETYHEHGDQHP